MWTQLNRAVGVWLIISRYNIHFARIHLLPCALHSVYPCQHTHHTTQYNLFWTCSVGFSSFSSGQQIRLLIIKVERALKEMTPSWFIHSENEFLKWPEVCPRQPAVRAWNWRGKQRNPVPMWEAFAYLGDSDSLLSNSGYHHIFELPYTFNFTNDLFYCLILNFTVDYPILVLVVG